MNDTKMLQAILDKISNVEKLVTTNIEETKKNGKRIDKLGNQLACLEDDAPTVEEFDQLEKRVSKIEKQVSKY